MESLRLAGRHLRAIFTQVARLAWFLTLSTQPALAQAPMPDEFAVRAAIIFNLTRFVTWPASKMADPHAPFVVGLLGYDREGAALEKFLAGRSIDGRLIVVRRLGSADRAGQCSLLYVTSTERKRYDALATELAREGVLTVSDDEHFVVAGGIVGLPVSGDHIDIQINLSQAQRSGLTISSRLLHLASVVRQEGR